MKIFLIRYDVLLWFQANTQFALNCCLLEQHKYEFMQNRDITSVGLTQKLSASFDEKHDEP